MKSVHGGDPYPSIEGLESQKAANKTQHLEISPEATRSDDHDFGGNGNTVTGSQACQSGSSLFSVTVFALSGFST